MREKTRYIIAIMIVLLFYAYAIIDKAVDKSLTVNSLLYIYLPVSIFGIIIILLLNRYLTQETIRAFHEHNGNILTDTAMGLLLLSAYYFIYSLANITYIRWVPVHNNQSEMVFLLTGIFSKTWSALLFTGPFIWFSEMFSVLSRTYILNLTWKLTKSVKLKWVAIFTTSVIFSLTNIDKGLPSVLNAFFILSISNILYYKYRRISPLLIAAILFQTIDLIAFWTYNISH